MFLDTLMNMKNMENCLASVLMRMSIMSLLQVKMQIDGGTFYMMIGQMNM